MSFATYLTTAAEEVEKELNATLTEWQSSLSEQYPALIPFISAFVEQCQGGKRVRGALVKLGYMLAGGKKPSDILPVSVAFEIFQTAILAHDDIIDRSELRRGKPSLYQALGGDHYGISQTISLGDLGFFLATELIAKSNFPTENKNKAIQYFTNTMQQTALGEILDVYQPTQKDLSKDDILTIIKLKTSPYTVIGPLSIGAILADADQELLRKIHIYGDNLGIAYQIHDDILGIFAEQEELGKSNMSDILEGKSTLLIWYAREHASDAQRQQLDTLYGKADLTKENVATIQTIFRDTGAYDYASALVKTYTETACNVIPELTADHNQQTLLMDIARFLSERKN
jgi:geranylgeranyl diphosphate synthase, type I